MTARAVGALGLLVAVAAASVLLGLAPSGSSETQPPTWAQIDGPAPFAAPPGTSRPSPRFRAAMAYDGRHGNVVLFGATNKDDTWIWDGRTWTEADVPPASRPPARAGATMAFDGRHVVLFGGDNEGHLVPNDTWLWDGDSLTWSRVPAGAGPSPPPGPRRLASMAYDEAHGTVVLFGGVEFATPLADTWTWNGATSAWTPVVGGLHPPARNAAAMTYDPNPDGVGHPYVLLFSGLGVAAPNLPDTWAWDGAWTELPVSPPTVVDGSSKVLTARRDAAMAFDAVTGKVVMFGGYGEIPTGCAINPGTGSCDATNEVDETWTWGGPGAGWHYEDPFVMSTNGHPQQRYGAMMAPEPGAAPRTVMVFGGFGGISFGDTWTWDGTSPLDFTTTTTSASTTTSTSTTAVPPAVAPSLPIVRRLDPPSGPAGGGTTVSIQGAGFTGATAVSFGDQRLDCSQPGVCAISDDGHLQVSSPAHARGTVDVRVTTAVGTSGVVRDPATGDDEFTYFPATPVAATGPLGSNVGGFGPGQPVQPAPPGGFGSVPVPGAGFSAAPGPGAAPAPGATAASPAGVVPPAPVVAGAPGLVPPVVAPSPLVVAGVPPDLAGAPAAAPHFNMVGRSSPGGGRGAEGPLGVAGGAMLVLFCFCARRAGVTAGSPVPAHRAGRTRPQAQVA